jgi:Mrp family chromosome partitioning ATPase
MGPAEYLRVVRARWWAVAALVLIGASMAWITTPDKPSNASVARFRAETVLVRGPSTTAESAAATNLAQVASLVGSTAVIERSAAELGRPESELTSGLNASVNDKAGTLLISSIDTDPARAVKEADTIAAQLMAFVAERRQQQLKRLIADTNQRIKSLDDRIQVLNAQLAIPGSPQLDQQRAERDSAVGQIRTSYDQLQQLTSQVDTAANELVVLSPAAASPAPTSTSFSVPNSHGARAGIGLVVGLLAGLALVLAFERINPKIRTSAQAEIMFGLPVIAEIPRESRRARRRDRITTYAEPHSVTAESFRGLRTALMYMPRNNEPDRDGAERFATGHVVLVTSAAPSEGKTTVVANLAAAFAEKDADVVVVSGDARQPAIESLLLGRRAAGAKMATKDQSDAVYTMVPGVKIVLASNPDSNPAEIVGYERQVVQTARARSQTVIIDTPPALIANDAIELMQTADSIVLVARYGLTTVASARRTAELIARLQVSVVGVVLIGSDNAAVADSSYYRSRPRRHTISSVAMHADAERRIPVSPAPTTRRPPASPATNAAEPVVATAAAPPQVDDGGIWRPKTVIDLNGLAEHPPMQPPAISKPAPPRPPRATVGDGYPSRDTLARTDADLTSLEDQRRAYHAGHGRRAKLPLFRAGDGNGNGPSR